jgi:hypothetical protein
MAKIVLGMWTSHGPTLSTTPEQWAMRLKADLSRLHPFKGKEYAFEELVALRAGERLQEQATLEQMRLRHARCQQAVEAMAREFERVKPDVAVIFGNDQRELFLEELTNPRPRSRRRGWRRAFTRQSRDTHRPNFASTPLSLNSGNISARRWSPRVSTWPYRANYRRTPATGRAARRTRWASYTARSCATA